MELARCLQPKACVLPFAHALMLEPVSGARSRSHSATAAATRDSASPIVRALPWLVAIAVLAYLFSTTNLAALGAQLRKVPITAYAAFIVLGAVANLLSDCLGTWKVYQRIARDIDYRSIVVVRGASYLPTIVNYHVGQVYLTWLLARRHGVPVARAAAGTLLVYVTVLGGLVSMTAGVLAFGEHVQPWVRTSVFFCLAGAVVYVLFLVFSPRWVRERRLVAPLFMAGIRGHIELLAWRTPHLLVLFASLYGSYEFFGIHIPLADALAVVPALLLVSAVPITPQGLGTRELVAIALLTRFASPGIDARGAILAAGTSWSLAMSAVQIGISLILAAPAARILSPSPGADGTRVPPRPLDPAPH
jgi:uncharacterized membrane protein YbhN (UPF0104 family)